MYELTQLFWYKPLFLTELIVAEGVFLSRLKRKSYFYLRLLLSYLINYAVAFAFPIVSYNALWCSFMFVCFFLTTILTMKLRYDESWLNIIFCAIAGYTVQHIAYEVYELIITAANLSEELGGIYGSDIGGQLGQFQNPITELIYFFDYIILYWVAYVLFGMRMQKNEGLRLKSPLIFSLVVLVLIIDIILSAIITYYAPKHFDRTYTMILCVFNILCCVLALIIQFELPLRKKLEDEVYILNNLRAQEEKQYETSKENIALINQKVHDLKHQIRKIGSSSSVNTSTLNEMESIISIYDSAVKTGNKAIDIILTEKSMMCNASDIKLTCIVDGKHFSFMSESDLYSLFGNILDNAIEAVSKLEREKRVITLTASRINDFLMINVRNYFDGDLTFFDGLPVTTKKDKQYHGYGMKSVKMTCEKYGGTLSVGTDDGIFTLKILFVMSESRDE